MMTKSKERAVHWYRWGIVFMLLLASSCGQRSLSDVDLEPLLIRPGDLPNELAPGTVRVIEPDPDVLYHDQALKQEIVTRNGELVGSVQVYLFGIFSITWGEITGTLGWISASILCSLKQEAETCLKTLI